MWHVMVFFWDWPWERGTRWCRRCGEASAAGRTINHRTNDHNEDPSMSSEGSWIHSMIHRTNLSMSTLFQWSEATAFQPWNKLERYSSLPTSVVAFAGRGRVERHSENKAWLIIFLLCSSWFWQALDLHMHLNSLQEKTTNSQPV
jgi:hypothetical protein